MQLGRPAMGACPNPERQPHLTLMVVGQQGSPATGGPPMARVRTLEEALARGSVPGPLASRSLDD